MQCNFTLYRNSSAGLSGWSRFWGAAGAAYSANGCAFYAAPLQGSRLKYARWIIAWTPNGTPNDPGDCRLVDVWNDEVVVADADPNLRHGLEKPQTWGLDITDRLNAIIDSGRHAYLLMELQVPAIVYSSDIECVWE